MRLLLALIPACALCQPQLSTDERAYLSGLAADTWASIAFMADGESPLPEDNTDMAGYTSVSNIGIYLACVASAEALGLIGHEEGVRRSQRVLEACEKLPTWEGFPHSWLQTKTLGPTDECLVSSVDLGNYEAGLLVCRQAYPELAERIGKLVEAMGWGVFYCPGNGWLHAGWNTRTRQWAGWFYSYLAADSRMASFLAIAHGAPVRHWQALERKLDDAPGHPRRAGCPSYAPGWMGGGLFMQVLTGLFIDEAGTPIGRSAANFAWAQVQRAKGKQPPIWGWSACITPDGKGYLGYGTFREEVVTPHGAALALMYLPHEAVACLRQMEALRARKPVTVGGQQRRWGFRDCLDLNTRQAPAKMLIWDQGMLLVACANALQEGCVQRLFMADPVFAAGREKISDYQVSDEQKETFWQEVERMRRGEVEGLALPEEAG